MSFRRRNKSSKVPNVKLRPADAEATAKSKARLAYNAISTAWALDSDGDELEGDSNILDPCPRPLKGLIICATGLTDKTSLFKKAVELGAVALHDLTDRVTHLIAEECGSAKYKCALERKIPIMGPSWILACHETWLKGDDVDLPSSINQHRLPIFVGVTLCVSGIEDVSLRTKINKLVTAQGGAYAKALERPVKVTHLLCSGDAETEKMRYADKFNRAGEANIQIVWEEWFWDCLEYGGRFEEDKYAVTQPRPERKSVIGGPPVHPLPQLSSAPPSSTFPTPSPAPVRPTTPVNKLANEEQTEEEEIVRVRRVPAETLQVWESVLRPRGFVLSGGRLQRSPSKSQNAPSTSPCPPGPGVLPLPTRARTLQDLPGQRQSALMGLSRIHSFAPNAKDTSTPKQIFRKTTSKGAGALTPENSSFLGGIREREEAEAEVDDVALPTPQQAEPGVGKRVVTRNAEAGPSRARAVFSEMKFQTYGEAHCDSVRKAIEGAGGEVLSEENEGEPDFIIVRLVSGSILFRNEQDPSRRTKYRTECWLERCVFEGKVCSVDEHLSFSPLGIEIPIDGANNVILSLSGLDQSEICWTRRLGRALGVTMAANFSRRTTHLLCPSGEGVKFDKAGEWRIPVVGHEWMAEIARTGIIPLASHFLIGPGGVRLLAPEPQPELELLMEVDVRYDGKGKGKQTETLETAEGGMSDITNGSRSRAVSHELIGKPTLSRLVLPEEEEQQQHGHEDWSFGTPNGLLSETSASPRFSIRQPPDLLNERSSPPPPSSSRAGSVATVDDGRSATRSPSPDKLEAQRALQESLANLLVLGKRTTDSDFDSPESRRPGKRTRPLGKSKTTELASNHVRRSPPSFATYEGTSSSLAGKHIVDQDRDVVARHDHVMHEDPFQRAEQDRLLALLGKSGSDRNESPNKREDQKAGTSKTGKQGPRPRPVVKKGSRRPGF